MAKVEITHEDSPIKEVILTLSKDEAFTLLALMGNFGSEYNVTPIWSTLRAALNIKGKDLEIYSTKVKEARKAILDRAKIHSFNDRD